MTNEEVNALPNNIKQIGSISDGNRIYMEDYACTYLEQYAHSDSKEKIAVLVGRNLTIDNENILFISGVIQGKYTITKNGITELTEKSWQYINKQLKLYFKDLEVVGWSYIQPGYEDYISEKLCDFQKNNITKGFQVLYTIDPTENISGFYKWNNIEGVFDSIKGYIIYYEKNEGMHEYMLENKIKTNTEENIIKARNNDAGAKAREAASKRTSYRARKKISVNQNRAINLLGSVSFVMLLVCFIMGAGLVQNDERIRDMEMKITALESQFQSSQSVFALSNEHSDEESSESTSEYTTESSTESTTEAAEEATEEKKYTEYRVKPGDTLIGISKSTYGTSARVSDIRELNNIAGNKIVTGDILLLP